jgi:LPXTG-site transpeptidase (sortase) family protein
MRGVRLLYLFALVTMLMLSACGGSAPGTEGPVAGNVSTDRPYIPEIPEVRSGKTKENRIPIRVKIPAIGIDGFIELVGIRPNGDLATPTQNPWEDMGWYDMGPYPGQRGSAVIDGHLDRPGGYPAVFWRLGDMRAGDDVQVTNNGGKTLHFRVTHIEYYAPDQAPIQDIFGNPGGIYLNLITCAGDWIPSQHQTALRVVVYTTLV